MDSLVWVVIFNVVIFNKVMNCRFGLAIGTAIITLLACAADAYSCKIAKPVSNVDMVREANVIVRARAENYAVPPKTQTTQTGFDVNSDSRIRFRALEVIRGKTVADVVLPGTLVDIDDFNDQPSPYTFVRPNGRRGSCFATSYRSGGEFLLMLKERDHGEFTINWYPLAPVNEQLHLVNDPWLPWVRKQASAPNGKSASYR
jgi:hypothetical protein